MRILLFGWKALGIRLTKAAHTKQKAVNDFDVDIGRLFYAVTDSFNSCETFRSNCIRE